MRLEATITCPHCRHQSAATMPIDACLYFFECPSCKNLLKPKSGDCCVFCSYGDAPCPPVQEARLLGTGKSPDCCRA